MIDPSSSNAQSPFTDLPAALVEDVLEQTKSVANHLLDSLKEINIDKEKLRNSLTDRGLIKLESDLGYPPIPTTCGTDGSYAIERLITTDLVAAAAVAVEGLTPPSETRHWPQPKHKAYIIAEPHLEDTATILRALMLGEELHLAIEAPHEVVMIDSSLRLPIIHFNQALNKISETEKLLRTTVDLKNRAESFLNSYSEILNAERSDKQYVGVPKYSTLREIGSLLKWKSNQDDRSMLTLLLRPGEMTVPLHLEKPSSEWHINTGALKADLKDTLQNILNGLDNIKVFYYKPHDWLPALRIEVASNIAENSNRLGIVVQGIKHQCATPSMLEPYPTYLADRMAKSLSRALPAFRQVATQFISEEYEGDISEVFFSMHGYRSESGR